MSVNKMIILLLLAPLAAVAKSRAPAGNAHALKSWFLATSQLRESAVKLDGQPNELCGEGHLVIREDVDDDGTPVLDLKIGRAGSALIPFIKNPDAAGGSDGHVSVMRGKVIYQDQAKCEQGGGSSSISVVVLAGHGGFSYTINQKLCGFPRSEATCRYHYVSDAEDLQ